VLSSFWLLSICFTSKLFVDFLSVNEGTDVPANEGTEMYLMYPGNIPRKVIRVVDGMQTFQFGALPTFFLL